VFKVGFLRYKIIFNSGRHFQPMNVSLNEVKILECTTNLYYHTSGRIVHEMYIDVPHGLAEQSGEAAISIGADRVQFS
jgi:hypothetical protein